MPILAVDEVGPLLVSSTELAPYLASSVNFKMVLTKNDLQQIKESINIKQIQDSIENLNETVTLRIDALENKIFADIKLLVDKNTALTLLVETNKKRFDSELDELRESNKMYEESDENTKIKLNKSELEVSYLTKKIVNLEKSVHSGLQHSRKWNVEIDGIPAIIGDDPIHLENATLKILNAIGVNCVANDIEAIHRLPSKAAIKPTIVRFKSRKTVDLIFKNKGKLKDLFTLNIDINGVDDESKIYIRPSLCPYFRTLAYNCRLLKKYNLISFVFTNDDGTLKIKTLNDSYVKIFHESDLTSRFNQFKHFQFTRIPK